MSTIANQLVSIDTPSPSTPDLRRLLDEAAQMTERGRNEGREVAIQLGILELLGIPQDTAVLARALGAPFALNFFEELPDPRCSWGQWESEVVVDTGLPQVLRTCQSAWSVLYSAVEQHVESGAEELWEHENGAVYLCPYPGANLYPWDGPWNPGRGPCVGHEGIGRFVCLCGCLPEPYAYGLARGVLEVAELLRTEIAAGR